MPAEDCFDTDEAGTVGPYAERLKICGLVADGTFSLKFSRLVGAGSISFKSTGYVTAEFPLLTSARAVGLEGQSGAFNASFPMLTTVEQGLLIKGEVERTFDIDVKQCLRCGHSPIRVVAVVAAPTREQLAVLGAGDDALPMRPERSRAPPSRQLLFAFARAAA